MRCIHCYNKSGDGVLSSDYSINNWLDIFKEISTFDLKKIVIGGGEPLLEMDKLYLSMDYLAMRDSSNIEITTNGYFVNKDFLKRLRKYKSHISIQISLDGHTPEINAVTRGTEEAWYKAISAIRMAQVHSKIGVVVAHTINKKNIDYVDDFINLMIKLNVRELLIGPVSPLGRANDQGSSFVLSLEKRVALVQMIRTIKEKHKNDIKLYIGTPGGTIDAIHLLTNPVEWLIIDSKGDVLLDVRFPYVVGNVFREDIDSIWEKVLAIQVNDEWINHVIMNYLKVQTKNNTTGKIYL